MGEDSLVSLCVVWLQIGCERVGLAYGEGGDTMLLGFSCHGADTQVPGRWEPESGDRDITAQLPWPLECVFLMVDQLIHRHSVI